MKTYSVHMGWGCLALAAGMLVVLVALGVQCLVAAAVVIAELGSHATP